jgi:hypothetical protein
LPLLLKKLLNIDKNDEEVGAREEKNGYGADDDDELLREFFFVIRN